MKYFYAVAALIQVGVFVALDEWACYDCEPTRFVYGLLLLGQTVVAGILLFSFRAVRGRAAPIVRAFLSLALIASALILLALLTWFVLPFTRFQ